MEKIKKLAPGVLLCLVIALAATLIVKYAPGMNVVGAPILGIIFGMIVGSGFKLGTGEPYKTGVGFTSKKILQTAVILLGFGLDLATVGKVGAQSLPVIVSTVSTSLIVAFIVCRIAKVPSNSATLIGVGSSICGGSAIAAAAPVIKASDEEIAQSISVVFLFNVIAAILYPTLGGWLGMSDMGFGLFAGTAINDTSSVTAAASTWDTIHGTGSTVLDYATIVKLTRVLCIIPICIGLSVIQAKKEAKSESGNGEKIKLSIKKMIPTFLILFVAASTVTTVLNAVLTGGALSGAGTVFGFLKKVSKFFIAMAMSAVGINTDVVKLIKTGGKPILLGFCCWVMIGIVSIIMQHVIGIF